VIDDADLPAAVERLALLDELRPDGLIVQDLGVARLVRTHFPDLLLHASTQLVAHNLEGVLALKELGFSRVVLARELSLEEIRAITRRCGTEIEVFVHGALCYSLSGLCLFSAMEKNRSGNRGKCAYCCRLSYADDSGAKTLPFSMRDLRLDDCLDALKDAGVASLKIEGRMKSPLYVASVTSHYRQLLDGTPVTTTRADLETVFSRRTTSLYIHGTPDDPIDPTSLGHLGTPVGTVKRLTKDREGRSWLRFHTNRALERHDGLQFTVKGEKPFGFGIAEMRLAISRKPVFDVRPGADVEVRVPDDRLADLPPLGGATVYCSASNEVKRRFPIPSFRPSDVTSGTPVDLTVTLAPDGITVRSGTTGVSPVEAATHATLTPAQHPERTAAAVEKAFARMGGTDWSLRNLTLLDPDHLFAPASLLNDLRRQLVERLDAARDAARAQKIAAALGEGRAPARPQTREDRIPARPSPLTTLKQRLDQPLPADAARFDEIVLSIGHLSGRAAEAALASFAGLPVRLALPVFTHERDVPALRTTVKHLLRAGYMRWEASDLATLHLLCQIGVSDISSDWTLYAFNRAALAELAALGVIRAVASPENSQDNLAFLAQSSFPVEFLVQQSTPLFISLTPPAAGGSQLVATANSGGSRSCATANLTGLQGEPFTTFPLDGLWITTRAAPRRFTPPADAPRRLDFSWDPPL
ncbi:MAG: U32 family peptidase, partial [Kiritimatiellae bacterium]|nr:U32 family peptidase [Kiritimatiellia bacterium]